ncbi:MAG TPA: putative toxin-antitoxin system toxin component, PIN family [Phycisphaerae bacterium]|nr:putative toxin-antitoxin system toxin component, PIN family [Phycisphaerae bacterium]
MTHAPRRVVYDCVVFAQALINPNGPAGECVKRAQAGQISLFVSDYLVREIIELYSRIPARYGVTRRQINDLADQVSLFGTFVWPVPSVYTHPIDPDDSPYVDLAMAANARIIVSRDRHLLNLMDQAKPEGREFKRLFPTIMVVTPDAFAMQLRAER